MKICICDDDKRDLTALRATVRQRYSEPACFDNPKGLLDEVADGLRFDVYILDVVMPDMNGIHLARLLRGMDGAGRIIFLTSSRDYAVDSYEVGAFYYLMKPVQREKLFALLDEIDTGITAPGTPICVHTRERDIMVKPNDIDYIESLMRFPNYHTAQGTFTGLMLHRSFKDEMAPLLGLPAFCLCGASFVLNLSHISSIGKFDATFHGGQSVTLPRSALPKLRTAWTDYWMDGEGVQK